MEPSRIEIEAKAKDMIERLKAVFFLAGIDLKSFHRLPNGYCSDECCPGKPWMLAETEYGLIKIGWRKRVISITWPPELKVHGKDCKPRDDHWVTDWESGVHAWGYGRAVEYLERFVHQVKTKRAAAEIKN